MKIIYLLVTFLLALPIFQIIIYKISINRMDYDSLKDILPKQVRNWFEQEVFIWLKFISLEQYFPFFQNKQLFGRKLFELNEENFQYDFQIKSRIIRKKFMYWIRIGLAEYDAYLNNNGITQKSQNSQSQSYFNRQFKSQYFQCEAEQNNLTQYFLKRKQSQSQTRKLSKSKNQTLDMKKSLKVDKIKNQLVLTQGTQRQAKLCYSFVNRGGYIGRHSSCQVMVLQDKVALQNCLIQYRQPNFYLNKFQYKFGTWKYITEKIKMIQWSMIEMGDNVFKFQIFNSGQIKIQIVDGPNKKQKFKFSKTNKIKIGRKINNQIHFLSDTSLSMYHARLTFQYNHWYFQDIGSTNGSWLFLQKQQLITSGMVFKVGRTMEVFKCQLKNQNQNPSSKQNKKIQLCQKCKINKKNSILNPCNHNVFCYQCSMTQKYCGNCHGKIISSTKIFHS